MASYLTIIRNTLEGKKERGEIVLYDNYDVKLPFEKECESELSNDRIVYKCGLVRFHLAPINPIYDADGLNSFMAGLIPQLTPEDDRDFYWKDGKLLCGWQRFKDVIGFERVPTKKIELSGDIFKIRQGPISKVVENPVIAEYQILVTVSPYPHEKIAEKARVGGHVAISKKELDYYRKLPKD